MGVFSNSRPSSLLPKFKEFFIVLDILNVLSVENSSCPCSGVTTDAASSETLYPFEVTGHPREVFHNYMMM